LSERRDSSAWTTPLYAAAALVAAFEAGVLWLALNPDVPPDYRAYYIDQSITCLPQPVSGDYAFGTWVSFRSGAEATIKPLRVCGWEGPAGDGLHAVGESSRLRFAIPAGAGALALGLELVAVAASPGGRESVVISANGTKVATLSVLSAAPQSFEVPIPAAIAAAGGKALDIELIFPDAVTMNPQDSRTRKRSIKLTMARVGELVPLQ
jgi:hypothetical protein